MNNKNITIITSYPLNNEPVIRNRLAPFIDEFLNIGCTVNLVSPDKEPYIPNSGEDINHIQLPPSKQKPRGFIARALYEYTQARQLIRAGSATKAELLLVTIPSMFLLFALGRSSQKVALDIRDMPWEYLDQHSLIQNIAKRTFTALAKRSIKKCSYISATTKNQIELAAALKVPEQKMTLLPNGVTEQQFRILSSLQVTKPSSSKKLAVGYIGNIGIAQNLTTLAEAAINLPGIKFIVAGAGTDYERVKRYVTEKNILNMELLGRVSWDEVPSIYESCAILYTQLSPGFESAIPSKLYEYLSTGKHVIYGGLGGEAEKLLADFEETTVIKADDAAALKEVINALSKLDTLQSPTANKEQIRDNFVRETNVKAYVKKIDVLS